MLTLRNEPDDGEVITVARIHDVERLAAPIPAGEPVQIVGLGVDESGDVALWSVAWRGNAYWCLPEELRLPHECELEHLQECY